MKKVVFLLSILLMFLTGCGQGEISKEETPVTDAPEADLPATSSPAMDLSADEGQFTAQQNYTEFFMEEQVHDLYVEISVEDWQALLANPQAKKYYSVTATMDDITITNVGFRTRGNSSLRLWGHRGSQRYPFRLKFDKYVDDQRFLGLDEMVLINSLDDPSFLREYLGYEAFRQLGMDVPYVTFFNLYINEELRGLYVGIEAIDNRFLNRAFGGHKGNLYEAGLNASLTPGMNPELMEQKKGNDESKTDISELIRILDEMPLGEKGEIESILDVDTLLRYMAANAVIHNWDDYAGFFCHNYYLYADNGIFHIIPWDMNEGFLQTQKFYQPSDGSRQDIATPITGDANPEERPLVSKILAVPEYYEQYLIYCEALLPWLETLPDTLPDLFERIDSSVENDPTKFYSYEEFKQQSDNSYHNGLAGFIVERADYLSERLPELMGNQ